jgi:hypothetical protein
MKNRSPLLFIVNDVLPSHSSPSSWNAFACTVEGLNRLETFQDFMGFLPNLLLGFERGKSVSQIIANRVKAPRYS